MIDSFHKRSWLPLVIVMISCVYGCADEPPEVKEVHRDSLYKVVELCNNAELRSEDSEVIPEFNGPVLPYNIGFEKSEDSINITFDFVSECCQKFDMQHIVRRKTLKLLYLPKEDGESCECYCDYRATYKAIDSEMDFNEIRNVVIRRGKRTK
ncbi:hypothetical protein OAK35_00490 [Crocinitomicaceae bacterium]|nr:hypothetical protein [Crocinitomicaceae bacterium]